jgi:soluble lytic murein transglycosylase-like protein
VTPARASEISCERVIADAAQKYQIPLAVFYAVGLNESGGAGGRLAPYAMNIDGHPSISTNLAQALQNFYMARARGAKMIDIGCMQINQHFHGAHFGSIEEMFDPSNNIDYAAHFLRDLKQREKTWTMAVARYNAGPDNDPAQKRYVCAVIQKMVASGFGAWTANARAFCF